MADQRGGGQKTPSRPTVRLTSTQESREGDGKFGLTLISTGSRGNQPHDEEVQFYINGQPYESPVRATSADGRATLDLHGLGPGTYTFEERLVNSGATDRLVKTIAAAAPKEGEHGPLNEAHRRPTKIKRAISVSNGKAVISFSVLDQAAFPMKNVRSKGTGFQRAVVRILDRQLTKADDGADEDGYKDCPIGANLASKPFSFQLKNGENARGQTYQLLGSDAIREFDWVFREGISPKVTLDFNDVGWKHHHPSLFAKIANWWKARQAKKEAERPAKEAAKATRKAAKAAERADKRRYRLDKRKQKETENARKDAQKAAERQQSADREAAERARKDAEKAAERARKDAQAAAERARREAADADKRRQAEAARQAKLDEARQREQDRANRRVAQKASAEEERRKNELAKAEAAKTAAEALRIKAEAERLKAEAESFRTPKQGPSN